VIRDKNPPRSESRLSAHLYRLHRSEDGHVSNALLLDFFSLASGEGSNAGSGSEANWCKSLPCAK
jgi:hypothetical protein